VCVGDVLWRPPWPSTGDWDSTFQTPIPHFRPIIEAPACPATVDLDFDSGEFARHWDAGHSGRAVFGFRVSSRERVDGLYSDLTTFGYVGQQPPYDAFWGARYAIVEDPDGNPVGIMSPVDPDLRSRPDFP
jgi:Glyoxalase/Bleomycin resistance protein/Dioxygenase superfamily